MLFLITVNPHAFSQSCSDYIKETTPKRRFEINEHEVFDIQTGLIWQKCSLGQTGDGCSGTADTFSWREAFEAARLEQDETGTSWRLPNAKELDSIVERKCINPAINLEVFPNTPYRYKSFWVSTHDASYPANPRFISFSDGRQDSMSNKTAKFSVRLVKDSN